VPGDQPACSYGRLGFLGLFQGLCIAQLSLSCTSRRSRAGSASTLHVSFQDDVVSFASDAVGHQLAVQAENVVRGEVRRGCRISLDSLRSRLIERYNNKDIKANVRYL
jgi:hypothetical protein